MRAVSSEPISMHRSNRGNGLGNHVAFIVRDQVLMPDPRASRKPVMWNEVLEEVIKKRDFLVFGKGRWHASGLGVLSVADEDTCVFAFRI